MDTQKKTRKKRGLIYLLVAAVLLIISFVLFSVGVEGGVIFGLISLGWVVSLIIGLVYLILGFVGKE